MKIGIEMRAVTMGSAGGVYQLLRGVLRCLVQRYPEHEYVFFPTVFNRSMLEPLAFPVETITLPLDNYFEQLSCLAQERQLDVLFRSFPWNDAVAFPLDRQIFQIPDIQHEYFPEFFDAESLRARRQSFNQALSGAGAIGTISDYARRTLLAQEACKCRDIFLMGPALQVEHSQAADEALTAAEVALIPQGDYFLYPANLWAHKNHRRVLEAFEKFLHLSGRSVEFVFTGHPAGWNKFQEEFGRLPIRHLGFVRAPVLHRLMEKAQALVFFSLYEGFGMPLLEAFAAGTPVICSDTTSLPEVGGDAVLSCDPTNVEVMSQLMARILAEDELRQTLLQRGQKRLKAYTWEASADNLLTACHRVACGTRSSGEVLPSNVSAGACHRAAALPSYNQARLPIKVHVVTEWPRVAIVTPSYNQGRFLKRTIDSVLTQNYPHIDYMVIDGGSSDESVDILKSYGDRFPWVSEVDRGQSHAINKGFARTRADIQAYLNSDDVLLPGAVDKVVNYMWHHPGCDLVYGQAHYIDENDNITGQYGTADYAFARLVEECFICQPATFWRARIARQVGPFDESFQFAMDYDYWMRMDRTGASMDYFHELLACSRRYPQTKTLSCRAKHFEEMIRVCTKHMGSASVIHFRGLWYHLCEEGWLRYLAKMPKFRQLMTHLHHRWHHRHRYTAKRLLEKVVESFQRRVVQPPLPAPTRLAAPPECRPAVPRSLYATEERTPQSQSPAQVFSARAVTGLWSDNWLAPLFTVRLNDSTFEERFHLAGIAPEATELTVLFQGRAVGVLQLQPEQMEKIAFEVAPGKYRNLVLQFSRCKVDAAGRKLAFLLQETNIFNESDLAA